MERNPWWGPPPIPMPPSRPSIPADGWKRRVWTWVRRWIASRIQPAGDQQPQDAADARPEAVNEPIDPRLRFPR